MQITILYFAALRELAGADREALTLPEEVRTVGALEALLVARHPLLRGRLASVRFARNERFAKSEEALADGDEIALIPPVAGGSR